MKYRVMLVDDEESIRSLLRMSIDWESLDMEIVGEAASGIEAINTIDDLHPHVMLVDIRMPFMDGIEFSGIAIKRYPRTKIIILTAHDDFEYARACIGIGVSDYLLKPIVRKEINSSLSKVKIQLDAEAERYNEEENAVSDMPVGDRIKEYIRYNYTDTDLNLTKAAQKFGFNSSYLSRRFKQESGQSFTDYLTECRMQQAMILAKQGMLMYQTARKVGVPDPNYFGKCFKKYTGVNYSAYVEMNDSLPTDPPAK